MAQWISGSFDIYVDSRGSVTSAQVSGFHTLLHDTTRHVCSVFIFILFLIGTLLKKDTFHFFPPSKLMKVYFHLYVFMPILKCSIRTDLNPC